MLISVEVRAAGGFLRYLLLQRMGRRPAAKDA
jgi:hypothetical protein